MADKKKFDLKAIAEELTTNQFDNSYTKGHDKIFLSGLKEDFIVYLWLSKDNDLVLIVRLKNHSTGRVIDHKTYNEEQHQLCFDYRVKLTELLNETGVVELRVPKKPSVAIPQTTTSAKPNISFGNTKSEVSDFDIINNPFDDQ